MCRVEFINKVTDNKVHLTTRFMCTHRFVLIWTLQIILPLLTAHSTDSLFLFKFQFKHCQKNKNLEATHKHMSKTNTICFWNSMNNFLGPPEPPCTWASVYLGLRIPWPRYTWALDESTIEIRPPTTMRTWDDAPGSCFAANSNYW